MPEGLLSPSQLSTFSGYRSPSGVSMSQLFSVRAAAFRARTPGYVHQSSAAVTEGAPLRPFGWFTSTVLILLPHTRSPSKKPRKNSRTPTAANLFRSTFQKQTTLHKIRLEKASDHTASLTNKFNHGGDDLSTSKLMLSMASVTL